MSRTEQKVFQRGNADDQRTHEKMLNIINYQGNENHNSVASKYFQQLHSYQR